METHATSPASRSTTRSKATLGSGLPDGACPVRFGNWVGGDRDGNPHVTAKVTAEAVLRARWTCARLWRGTLERLRDELSVVTASEVFKKRANGEREAYRAVITALLERITASERWCEASVERIARELAPEPAPPHAILDSAELLKCSKHARIAAIGAHAVVADGCPWCRGRRALPADPRPATSADAAATARCWTA